jgi:hypothetical protein
VHNPHDYETDLTATKRIRLQLYDELLLNLTSQRLIFIIPDNGVRKNWCTNSHSGITAEKQIPIIKGHN